MKIIIISALGNTVLRRCMDSLLQTAPLQDADIHVIRERGMREETLNAALDLAGREDDLLFVGDDIVFTPGWHEALTDASPQADILGMSMRYPDSDMIQDRGYDLVRCDGRVVLRPLDRGRPRQDVPPFGLRPCAALCGCFLFIKKNVFSLVPRFNTAGMNRWGEFIFLCMARRQGATVAVIDHIIVHAGKSTKSNPDPVLRSTSYQVEREMWDRIADKWVDEEMITLTNETTVSPQLRDLLSRSGHVLLYGAGTVSEKLLPLIPPEAVTICSGLVEEEGTIFHGHPIVPVQQSLQGSFDLVVLTPLHRAGQLYERFIVPSGNPRLLDSTIGISLCTTAEGQSYTAERLS